MSGALTDDRERRFAFSENHNDGADASIRLGSTALPTGNGQPWPMSRFAIFD